MKKFLLKATISVACIAAIASQTSQAAVAGGIGNNYIGPSVSFGGGSSVFGIDSKIGIADNFALRPFVTFPSGGTQYGTSLTYDWDLRQAALPITPFVGLGLNFRSGNGTNTNTNGFAQVGADFNVSDSFALLGAIAIPFNGGDTSFTLGSGVRF